MLSCPLIGSAHLPVMFAIVFITNLAFTYCVAVLREDVDPMFPYVSAAGDHRPESCIFSLLLNLSSFLIMLIIYLRYRMIDCFIRDSDTFIIRLNNIGLFFGLAGGLGMMVVANFQETALIMVHLCAALITFGGGCIYMVFQTLITVRMHPLFVNRRIGGIRAIIAICSVIAFFTAFSFGWYAAHTFHQVYPDLPTPRPWSRRIWQPGYNFHVVSAIAEWFLAVMHVAFILTYSRDFEKIRVKMDVESLVTHLDHSPRSRSYEDLLTGYVRHNVVSVHRSREGFVY